MIRSHHINPVEPSVCACGNPDVVTDDGPVLTCRPCLAAMARIAADPASAHPAVLEHLQAQSLDVVALTVVVDRTEWWSEPVARPVWFWTSQWPRKGDHTLMRGGVA